MISSFVILVGLTVVLAGHPGPGMGAAFRLNAVKNIQTVLCSQIFGAQSQEPMIARDGGINLCVATMSAAGDFSAQCNKQRRLASTLRQCRPE
jgi:hypothetical protein